MTSDELSTSLDLHAETLTGDVASFLIDRLRNQEAAYRYLGEDMQREVIADAQRAASTLVREAVKLIAADGRDTIPVRVKKVVNDGDKIQVTIEARKEDEHRHDLFDAAGLAAMLIVADADKYEAGEAPVPDPDQPDLPGTDEDKDAA